MSERTKKIGQYDKDFVWHPFTQMKEYEQKDPIVIEDSDGAYLIDTEGKRYIDGVSSLWVNIHGHKVPEIDNAINNQGTAPFWVLRTPRLPNWQKSLSKSARPG